MALPADTESCMAAAVAGAPLASGELRRHLACALETRRDEGAQVETHPLGFLRLPLTISDRRKPGFYLHVWPGDLLGPPQDEGIHCHIFDLRSRILVGRLRDVAYDVAFDGIGPQYLYDIVFEATRSRRQFIQRVTCRRRAVADYRTGQVYGMPRGQFHATVIPGGFTATLMWKSNVDLTAHPYNVTDVQADESTVFEHVRREAGGIDQGRAWSVVLEVLDRLQPEAQGARRSPP